MTRISKNKLTLDLENKALEEILKEIKKVKSEEDLNKFINMFFTEGEKHIILRRTAVINLLKNGKKYSEIKNLMEISRATISNVRDILDGRGYGKNPERKRKYSPMSWAWAKDQNKIKRPKTRLRYKGGQGIV